MRKEHWYLDPSWPAIYREAVIAERVRIEETVRFRIGELLLTLLFRPWRLRYLLSLIFSFMKKRNAVEPCFSLPVAPPSPPVKQHLSHFPPEDLPLRLAVRDLWREIDDIKSGLSYRLGAEVIQMKAYPWRLIMLPLIIWRLAHEPPTRLPPGRPASEGVPQLERAVPRNTQADAPETARAQTHGTRDNPSLTAVGPSWLMEMLAYEGVLDGRGSAPIDGPLLICLDSAQQEETFSETLSTRLSTSAKVVAWVMGPVHDPRQIELLGKCQAVFVLEPEERARLSELLPVKVSALQPFVQPRIHNPIGYWDTAEQGMDDIGFLPKAFQPLINLSRGINKPHFTDKLSPYFNHPVPSFLPSSWMNVQWAHDFSRAGYVRWALTSNALSNRLDEVREVLSNHRYKATSCLASAVITTMRPDSIDEAVAGIVRQKYSSKEIVLVLHGEGFNLEKTKRDMAALGIQSTVLTAPAEWTLGEALQKGCENSSGDVIFKIDDDDWYSENYLSDQITTLNFSDAGVVGKNTRPLQFVNNNNMYLMSPGFEYRYGEIFGGCTFAMRREVFQAVGWRAVPRFVDAFFVDDCLGLSIPLFSGSKFNFVYRRNSQGGHTWSATEKAIVNMYNASALPDTAEAEDFNLAIS